MASKKGLIVVIGAGVTGLQTSISLRKAGYEVIIIGKHFPGDTSIEYTSPWAGAHWRSHAGENEPEQQQWDIETYQHWLELIENERAGSEASLTSGLVLKTSRHFSVEVPWYADTVLDYKVSAQEAPESSIHHAYTYTSIAIDVPVYLAYLQETARSLGVQEIREALPSMGNLSKTIQAATEAVQRLSSDTSSEQLLPSAFVNATGIAALNVVPDPAMYPVRGQTVLVRGESEYITTVDAGDPQVGSKTPIMYILPRVRSGTTVLGGTKDAGNWSGEPDPDVTAEILARTKRWAPELLNDKGEFEVLSVQAGLRPARKGGVRVEVEKVGDFIVCHAYGHAGAGYQNSVGSANKVVRLIESSLDASTLRKK